MKRHNKLLVSIVLLLAMLMSLVPVCAFAAEGGTTIYFTPNSNWRSDNARFAMYTWIDGGDYHWIELSDSDDDGVYEGILPDGYTDLIFVRLDPSESHTGWSTSWNQTNDLKYDGEKNHYTVGSGVWDKGDGKWSVFDPDACVHEYGADDICTKCGEELFYIIAGNVMKADGSYREGDNSTLFVSAWDVTDENNRMTYDQSLECYVKVYENVAKGEYHFKVVENKSWDISYGWDGGNCYINVEEDGSRVVITFKGGSITCAADRPMRPDSPDEQPDTTPDSTPDSTPDEAPDDSTKEPAVKLNFFQRIWLAIKTFFKRLFGGK